MSSVDAVFHTARYLRSTFRRLEHLAMLRLPIDGRSVLEIGAGIGDLTSFFLDRECVVTSVEPRAINVACFRSRYDEDPLWPRERLRIVQAEVAGLADHRIEPHDVVFCYGAINELDDPESALHVFSEYCRELLVLEVAVDSGPQRNEDTIRFHDDRDRSDVRGSTSGRGSLPTRRWVFGRLEQLFEHVYMTVTQPAFDRFRLDWRQPATGRQQDRVIFVATRQPLVNDQLTDRIPEIQIRA